jgi:hypothetical protein
MAGASHAKLKSHILRYPDLRRVVYNLPHYEDKSIQRTVNRALGKFPRATSYSDGDC